MVCLFIYNFWGVCFVVFELGSGWIKIWGSWLLKFKPHCHLYRGPPSWLRGKEPTCQCKGLGLGFLVWEDALEKEMTTHCSILAWRIPWPEEPGGLQSMCCKELDWAHVLKNRTKPLGKLLKPWASYSIFLCLTFLICKMGILIIHRLL